MKWTVARKLSLSFAILIAVIMAVAGAGLVRDARIEDRMAAIYTRGVVATRELGKGAALLHRIRARAFHHALSTNGAEMDRIEREIADYEVSLRRALETAEVSFDASDDRRAHVRRVLELYRTYSAVRNNEVFPSSRRGDVAKTVELLLNRSGPPFEEVHASLEDLLRVNVTRTEEVYADAREVVDWARRFSVAASLLAAAIAVGLATMLARSIGDRIGQLASVARAVTDGDASRRAAVTGTDEITELGVAFNKMTDSLASQASEARARAAEQSAKREHLSATIGVFGAFVERVARGDLTTRLPDSGGELSELGRNLDAMTQSLATISRRVRDSVASLTTAATEILSTTQEQSASATESAAAVTETIATVEEVTRTAQQVTERSIAVATAAQESVNVSVAGRLAVERTITAMTGVRDQTGIIAERILALSEQAQAVGQIITTVNEIAEQSNMLALNAAIEAAGAGEHGRRFAVVAHEMRSLAEQSKAATAEVRSILGEIQKSTTAAVLVTEEGGKAVNTAVESVRHAGERIEQLTSTIGQSFDVSQRIGAAVQQLVTGVAQISQAMHSIDQATSQTVEATRQSERAARDLSELGGRLRDAVAEYKT